MSSKSPFHDALSSFLIDCVEKKVDDEALNWKSFRENPSFEEILEGYHYVLANSKYFAIEQRLHQAFPNTKYPLKLLRGLPRLYKKENPSEIQIKPPFAHLPSVMRLGAEKFFLPLYEKFEVNKGTVITLFTHILSDGFGDLIAHKEALSILKKRFPTILFQSVVTLPNRFTKEDVDLGPDAVILPYKEKSKLSKKAIDLFKDSDLVLSIPTHHPQIESLQKESIPLLCIGEHGFIESDTFHPKTPHRSMGLHFLEKGILIRENEKKGDFRCLKNETLLFTLFGTLKPQHVDIETYLISHKLHLAYLSTPIGGAIYLHALLKAAARDQRTIDICTPDIGWLIEFMKRQGKEKKPFLFDHFGIQELEIHFSGKVHRKKIQPSGKKVRLICTGPLSDEDFSTLIRLSEEFVAIRGDQSFSEAVSANKLYFYDAAPHKRYFVKDLLALAENRLAHKKEALTLFRSIAKGSLYSTVQEGTKWVEETHFQTVEPWEDTAISLSQALLNRDTLIGCRYLNQIIRSEYSFNQPLCQLVLRELAHQHNPEMRKKEDEVMERFIRGDLPLEICLEKIKQMLET